MKTAEKIWDKHFKDWIIAGQIKTNAMPVMEEYARQKAIEFEAWINDNGWIRDPFPRKDFNDDKLRYTNIGIIDIDSDEELTIYTVEKLYELFSLSQQKSKNNID